MSEFNTPIGLHKVSKIEVAQKQLETAVWLLLSDGDPISIHTLTTAASDVLRVLGAKSGVEMTEIDTSKIKNLELKKKVLSLLRKPQNFFKHADRDHDSVLEYNPELTRWFLLDACVLYENITNQKNSYMLAFRSWMMVKHQKEFAQVFPDDDTKEKFLAEVRKLNPDRRKDFLRLFNVELPPSVRG